MGTKFSDFYKEILKEAQAEGPEAIKLLDQLHKHYRLSFLQKKIIRFKAVFMREPKSSSMLAFAWTGLIIDLLTAILCICIRYDPIIIYALLGASLIWVICIFLWNKNRDLENE